MDGDPNPDAMRESVRQIYRNFQNAKEGHARTVDLAKDAVIVRLLAGWRPDVQGGRRPIWVDAERTTRFMTSAEADIVRAALIALEPA